MSATGESTASHRLSLKMLGRFEVLAPEGLTLPTRKAEALLAYLALPAGRQRSRGELTALLWGSRDEKHGRHSLNQALSSLRKLLSATFPDLFQVDGAGVGLAPALVTSDVARLEALLEVGTTDALAEAADLFTGDLLSGMELREEVFESWMTEERRRLRDSMMAGFHRLLNRQSDEGMLAEAVQTARTILRLDPLDESAHRRLMKLYALNGQRNAALRQYRECNETLRRELGVAPDSETRGFYERLLRGEAMNAFEPMAPLPTQPPHLAMPGAQAPAVVEMKSTERRGPPALALRRFTVIGADSLDQAVADAFGEDLLIALNRDRGLTVVGHRGIEGPNADAVYVVEGSLRRFQEQICVSAHLLDVGNGSYLWSERWAEPMANLMSGDDSWINRLAAVVKREVEGSEARKASESPPDGLGPWSYYHLALRELYRFTMPGLVAARSHFKRALAMDGNLAPAYARLAYVYLQMYWYGPHAERDQFLLHGIEAAERAVGLDPKDGHGHFALGRLLAIERSFDQAIPEFETALGLDPSMAQASFGLGQALSAAGQPMEAIAHLDQAIDLDPQDPHLWTFYHDRAEARFAQGRLAEAERDSKTAVRLPNASHFAWATLVAVLGAAKKLDSAQQALRRLKLIKPGYSVAFARDELTHHANRTFVSDYLEGLERAGLELECDETDEQDLRMMGSPKSRSYSRGIT